MQAVKITSAREGSAQVIELKSLTASDEGHICAFAPPLAGIEEKADFQVLPVRGGLYRLCRFRLPGCAH
ncbi:MAG: hypothetical protein OQJ76_03770, partial [Rhodospirillales bacterium]|nr:hypothetical protein [Rhodospirillales bacterium]